MRILMLGPGYLIAARRPVDSGTLVAVTIFGARESRIAGKPGSIGRLIFPATKVGGANGPTSVAANAVGNATGFMF